MPLIEQVIVWAIIGLIGGGLAGRFITWEKQGLGWSRNLVLGLAGALVGGFIFWIGGILPELDRISVSLRDVVAAVVGSFVVLGGLWLWRRSNAGAP